MAELEYFVVAESVSVDQLSNRISIFNIIERASFPTLPAQLYQAVAVAHWNLDDAEIGTDFQVEILISGTGEPVRAFRQNFQAIRPKHRTLCYFSGLPMTPGRLTFDLRINGTHKAYHHVDVEGPSASEPANRTN